MINLLFMIKQQRWWIAISRVKKIQSGNPDAMQLTSKQMHFHSLIHLQ